VPSDPGRQATQDARPSEVTLKIAQPATGHHVIAHLRVGNLDPDHVRVYSIVKAH
jgi:hypothetical protein